MKTAAQLAETVERFQEVFWDKRSTVRPPVGVAGPNVFLPIRYLRRPFARATVSPEDLAEELVETDYEAVFANAAVTRDDWLPFSAAWRGIPWLEAACGCPVRYAAGSLAPGHCIESLQQLADAPIPVAGGWLGCLWRQTERLVASASDDTWISPTILRGASDVLAAMRGLSEFYCDLYDDVALVRQAAARVSRLLIDVLDRHFAMVPPKLGGYSHVFGYWAPGKTIALQQDVLGACSPAVYRNHFMPLDAEVVRSLGPYVLFHLHSTGYRHYRDVLAIPGLAGLQITVESNGPPLSEMVPALREILEQSRLILSADSGFDQLPALLKQLPREGLYLTLRDDHIRSDAEFVEFVRKVWG